MFAMDSCIKAEVSYREDRVRRDWTHRRVVAEQHRIEKVEPRRAR